MNVPSEKTVEYILGFYKELAVDTLKAWAYIWVVAVVLNCWLGSSS